LKFEETIDNFLNNLKVVETFVIGVEEMVFDKQKKSEPEELKNENIQEILKSFSLLLNDDDKITDQIEEINKKIKDCTIEVRLDEDGKRTMNIKTNGSVSQELSKSLAHIKTTTSQVKMIYESSLISLAVYFELLVTSLIEQRLNQFPEAMNIEKKSLTISEIEELGSLEEAKSYLIEREVVGLMHSGFKDWLNYFKTNMKVPLQRIEPLIEEINEVFNRRNLFVHGGGIVNNIYLRKVQIDMRKNIKKGDRLQVDNKYILKTIDSLRNFGSILALEVWKTLEKTSETRPFYTNNLIVELLGEKNWTLIKLLCDFNIKDKGVPEAVKWQSAINYWLAMKELGEFEKVIKDVKATDFSAFSKEFQLCQLALLEEYDNFFKLLENYPKSVTAKQLMSWPVFSTVRLQPKYFEFIRMDTSDGNNDEEKKIS
jgi:hypothetical protein